MSIGYSLRQLEWYEQYQKFDDITSVDVTITKGDNSFNGDGTQLEYRNIDQSNIDNDNATVSIFYKTTNGRWRPAKTSLFVNIRITNNGNGSLTLSGVPRSSHKPSYIVYLYYGVKHNPKPLPTGTVTTRTIEYLNTEIKTPFLQGATAEKEEDDFISKYRKQYTDSTKVTLEKVIRWRGELDDDGCVETSNTIAIEEYTDAQDQEYEIGDEVYEEDTIYRKIASGTGELSDTTIWENVINLED